LTVFPVAAEALLAVPPDVVLSFVCSLADSVSLGTSDRSSCGTAAGSLTWRPPLSHGPTTTCAPAASLLQPPRTTPVSGWEGRTPLRATTASATVITRKTAI
jgi:hypothetical protein